VLRRGEQLCGHEFHRWQLHAQPGSAADGELWNQAADATAPLWQLQGWGGPRLHASWLHLHWGGCPELPRRLAAAARRAPPVSAPL